MPSGNNRPAVAAGITAVPPAQAKADRCRREADAMFEMAMAAMLRDERLEYLALAEQWLGRAEAALRTGDAGQVDLPLAVFEDV